MPELKKDKISSGDFAAKLVNIDAKNVGDWEKKALALGKSLEIVDAEGNPIDATIVVNALKSDMESEYEDEAKAADEVVEEEDEAKGAKAMADVFAKSLEKHFGHFRKEIDGRIKGLEVGRLNGRNDDSKKLGFKNFGEMALAVRNVALQKGMDQRLLTKAPTTFSNGNVGADGAFSIAPDFQAEILRHMLEQPSIMQRCRQLPTSSNSIEIPIDKTTPWGSDGLQAYWVDTDEADAISQSKLKMGKVTVNLHELAVLAPVSNNLLEDSAVALSAYLTESAASRITYKIDDAILNGTGSGQPLGIRNSGALKTVSRTTGTGLDIAEITDLIGAVPASALRSSGLTFLTHNTALPYILRAKIGDSPIFTPVGGGEGASAVTGRMYNIPTLIHEVAQAADSAGDLGLHDFSQYLLVTKSSGGLKTDMSMHFYFDVNHSAFRFIFRVGGQPWTNSTISQANGGGTVSPFAEIGAS